MGVPKIGDTRLNRYSGDGICFSPKKESQIRNSGWDSSCGEPFALPALLYQVKCDLSSISCCRVLGQNRPWWETPEVLLGGIDFRPSFARGSFIGAPLNLQERLTTDSVGYSPAAPLRSGQRNVAPPRTNLKRVPHAQVNRGRGGLRGRRLETPTFSPRVYNEIVSPVRLPRKCGSVSEKGVLHPSGRRGSIGKR